MFKKIVINFMPLALRLPIFKLKVLLLNPQLWRFWNQSFAIEGKPILLISLPRSGSSWLGEVLAQQDDVRYLREPITSTYMSLLNKGFSFFMPNCCRNSHFYQEAMNKAFSATLNHPGSVLHNPALWRNPKDKKKLFIKEVNPLFLKYFISNFNPRIIYLERCIYASAKSFFALGWKQDDLFTERFDKTTMDKILSIQPDLLEQDFYFQMGFLQGVILAINEPFLNNDNVLRTRYEDILVNPKEEISKITKFLDYKDVQQVYRYLEDSLSSAEAYQIGCFTTKRDSQQLYKKHAQEKLEPDYIKTIEAHDLAYQKFKVFVDATLN